MIKHLIRFELKKTSRSGLTVIMALVLFGLMLFAVYNGQTHFQTIENDIQHAQTEQAELEALNMARIDSLNNGLMEISERVDPRRPMAIGWNYPRVAAKIPAPAAFVSTGQSDLFANRARPRLNHESMMPSFTEMANPVKLMFGSFDVAFVTIFLIPLFIIGFGYNLLSGERDLGTLRMLLAEPVSKTVWLTVKTGVRFAVLWLFFALSFLSSVWIIGIPLSGNLAIFSLIIFLSGAYFLFWFLLALIVNLTGKSSSRNAVSLLAIWILLVLIIPALLNHTANKLYPLPSRAEMIADVREIRSDAEQRADFLLADYVRDHPELYVPDEEQQVSAYWLSYFAAQQVIREEIDPVIDQFDSAVSNRQALVSQLRILSPAVLLLTVFNDVAETSTAHYQSFREQVITFTDRWRNYFIPKIYSNAEVTESTFREMPDFEYIPLDSGRSAYDAAGLLLYLLGTWSLFLLMAKRKTAEELLSEYP